MLLKIVLCLAVLLIALVIAIVLQPADFTVVRTTSIHAPPEAVFSQVNDFHRWNAWSPWAKIDPSMQQTFEGPTAGPGAAYTWVGNAKVGSGRMAITDGRPGELIRIDLTFLRPFKAHNLAEFTFRPEGDHTNVTWKMTGKCNFLSKAMNLFVGMDKLLGPDFEKGLAAMKTVAETLPR